MPLRETTIVFEEGIDAVEQEREELLDEAADLQEGTHEYTQKVQRGKTLDSHLDGLEWAQTAHEDDDVPAWDEDVDAITLSGLATGDVASVKADMKEAGQNSDRDPAAASQVYQIRAGTVDAPYVGGEMDTVDEVAAIASLPASFARFAEDKIQELSSVGNSERPSFEASLAARQSE